MTKGKAIVLVGNPSEGYVAVGPFESMEDALSSDAAAEPDSWAMSLIGPSKDEPAEVQP